MAALNRNCVRIPLIGGICLLPDRNALDDLAVSGLIGCPNLANPRPEKSAYACVASSYAPTEIARLAVDGIVSVVSGDAVKKRVSLFSAMPAGSHRSY